MSATEAADAYRVNRKLAKRYVAENGGDEWAGCLPVLEIMVPEVNELNTVSMGIVDAPIAKVKGTIAAGRSAALAGNFLPLLPENSEFAAKWMSLYASHIKEGIRDPGTAYEYLGGYYIVEGHKRISVLTAVGAKSVQLSVQRILPQDDATDVQTLIYKEFLNIDNRFPLRGLWFSKQGSFTWLYNLAREENSENPSELLFDAFYDFRTCYYELGFGSLQITTGDAFFEFVKIYGLPYKWEPHELRKFIKLSERQLLYTAGTPATQIAPSSIEIVTNENDGAQVLRRQLEQKDTLLFLCSKIPRDDILPTFYGKMDEPSFVLGALAGSLTKSGVVGFLKGGILDNSEAFERGVQMVGARNTLAVSESIDGIAGSGADIALLPYEGKVERGPSFPGIYARLAGLTNGHKTEYYAAAAWDFNAFHKMVSVPHAENTLLSGAGTVPVHILLGLESGLLRLHLNSSVLSPLSIELVKILTDSFKNG